MSEPQVVRASYLSTYADCPRRAAARIFRPTLVDAGYEFARRKPHIGAATGSATHAAIASSLTEKVKTGQLGNETAADQAGLEALDAEIERGVSWDGTTPDLNTAQKQVLRQHHVYRQQIGAKIQPTAVEQRLEALHHATGFVVSGQSDVVVTTIDARLRDTKTGTQKWANGPQYGGYAMLLDAHGLPVISIIEDYIRRAKISEAQPAVEEVSYSVERCKLLATSVLRHMRRDLDLFQATGSPLAFLANPNSVLCSDKFCPAWGTAWCTEHKE